MSTLTNEQKLGEIAALRIKLKTNRGLRADFVDAVEAIMRKHGVSIDPDIRNDLALAIADEIGGQLTDVVLPGGTNC